MPYLNTCIDLSLSIYIYTCVYYQSEGILERINEPPLGRCLQGAVDAPWVVVVCCCCRRPTGGSFWTNRAEAHGQLVLPPVRLPEQLRSSRWVYRKPRVEYITIFVVPRPNSLYFRVFR